VPETITGKSLSDLRCDYCGEGGNGYQGPITKTFDGPMHEECGANYRAALRRLTPEQWNRWEKAKQDARHAKEAEFLRKWMEEAEGKTLSQY